MATYSWPAREQAQSIGKSPNRLDGIAKSSGAAKYTYDINLKNQLIAKGMIWSPNHGDTAFTVPLFDQFMHRIMPGYDWKL